VLDISSARPSGALTVRSFKNENDGFLMTTFPITVVNQAVRTPVGYPLVAHGDAHTTGLILLNLAGRRKRLFYDDSAKPMKGLTWTKSGSFVKRTFSVETIRHHGR